MQNGPSKQQGSHPAYFTSPKAEPLLKHLPKCNIHTHLEGSIRPETLSELAKDQGIDLKIREEDLPDQLQVNGEERDLVDYLRKISYTYQVLKNPQALKRTAYEAAEDAAADGVIYLELRAGPVTHSTPKLSYEQVILSILEGLQQAEQDFNIVCRLIVSALRNHDPENNIRLSEIAVSLKGMGVAGFDLAGDEAGYKAEAHIEAFEIARKGGLGITVHAGEAAGAENVEFAVTALEARRIGHGVRSIESPKLMKILQERRVLLEVCPTSNVHTRAVPDIYHHPVRQFFLKGIPVSIGDDDPITSCTHVSNELTLLKNELGFSLPELKAIQAETLEFSFLENSNLKRQLKKKIESFGIDQ